MMAWPMSVVHSLVILEASISPVVLSMPEFDYCFAMQILIRLIGADETMYSSYTDSMQWLDDIKVLEMIVDKFSTSVRIKFSTSSAVHFLFIEPNRTIKTVSADICDEIILKSICRHCATRKANACFWHNKISHE
jgi:hypothetical protein